MRIGFFSGVYFPRKDGACYTVKSWKQELESRGHDVYVIYPGVDEYEPGENEIPVASMPDPWYEGHRWPLPLGTRKFPELDVVHCHSPGLLGLMGRYYAWRKDIPSIFTFHTPLEEYAEGFFKSKALSRLLGKIFVEIDERYLRTFDRVTSNTGELRDRDVDALEVPAGVDTGFFYARVDSFLDETGCQRPFAGYSGRLSEEKNIEHILEMAEGFEGTVFVVGNGRQEDELKEISGENVVFMDYLPRENLPEFYSGLDVFVHASDADTFSLTSMEANACGTPVVAPDVRPFTAVINGESGELYSFGDTADFRRKVEKALEKNYDTRGSAMRYSVDSSIDRLEDIYGGLHGG
ncbi:MAG: glycosyltransferase [Candidatus Nanohaloarchaea archaeon]